MKAKAAQAVMKNLIADNDLLATLFANQNIEPIGNDKFMYLAKGIRFAMSF